jgi:hypothetical protein
LVCGAAVAQCLLLLLLLLAAGCCPQPATRRLLLPTRCLQAHAYYNAATLRCILLLLLLLLLVVLLQVAAPNPLPAGFQVQLYDMEGFKLSYVMGDMLTLFKVSSHHEVLQIWLSTSAYMSVKFVLYCITWKA